MKLLTSSQVNCPPHLFFKETSEKHLRQLLLSNYNNLTKSKKLKCAFLRESKMVKAQLVNQLLLLHFY